MSTMLVRLVRELPGTVKHETKHMIKLLQSRPNQQHLKTKKSVMVAPVSNSSTQKAEAEGS
jgi:hypothetical protein